MILKIKRLTNTAKIPVRATRGASGFDLFSDEEIIIKPQERIALRTGISLEIPVGYEIQIRPRSGLSLNSPLLISNSPGTVDSDYRGEIKIILYNTSNKPFLIEKGLRVAQMVLCPIITPFIVEVDELNITERGLGGFGSTGK